MKIMIYLVIMIVIGICTIINYHNMFPGWWFGTMEFYDFPYIGNFIIPTDELIFFRVVGIPPTRLPF